MSPNFVARIFTLFTQNIPKAEKQKLQKKCFLSAVKMSLMVLIRFYETGSVKPGSIGGTKPKVEMEILFMKPGP